MTSTLGDYADWIYGWKPSYVSMEEINDLVRSLQPLSSADKAARLWQLWDRPQAKELIEGAFVVTLRGYIPKTAKFGKFNQDTNVFSAVAHRVAHSLGAL